MFRALTINNFRGIRTSKVEDLSQINLFFGKNNCGKSSVLEAIFLITGQSNPTLPFSVNTLRDYRRISESDLTLNFYNQQDGIIRITAEGDLPRSLEISTFHSQNSNISLSDLEDSVNQQIPGTYGLNLKYRLGNKIFSSRCLIPIKEGEQAKIEIDNNYKESIFSEYLPASYLQVSVAKQYEQIVADKQEKTIVDILRSIEPKIQDMHLVGNQLFVDLGMERRLPINVLGDGIRKLLSIILCMFRCRNGVLLIDEIDNGFHHSVMPQLWKAVFMSAAINNTQVFVTTHNIESMKKMIEMLHEPENNNYQTMLSAYKLIKDNTDKVTSIKYQFEQMDYSIKQEMEIR